MRISRLRDTWRSPLVVGGLGLHLLLVVAITVLLGVLHPEPLGDRVMLAVAPLILVPVVAVVVACRREFDALPEGLLRIGATLALLLPLGVVELVLASLLSLVGVVDGDTHEGLDYVLGGAGLSLLVGGFVLGSVSALLGVVLRFLRDTAGTLPWHERWGSLPLLFATIVPIGLGAILGVDTGEEPRYAASRVLRGLLGIGEVTSPAWLWVGRVSALLLVVALVQLVRAGRRLRRAGDPRASDLVHERWLKE